MLLLNFYNPQMKCTICYESAKKYYYGNTIKNRHLRTNTNIKMLFYQTIELHRLNVFNLPITTKYNTLSGKYLLWEIQYNWTVKLQINAYAGENCPTLV